MRGLRARIILLALMTMVMSLVPGIASAATMTATIDFEAGLASGDVVTSLSNGLGISGDNIGGSVGVTATGGSGKAMIFDAAGPHCTSVPVATPDPDLCSSTIGIGKMLIVSENGGPNDWQGGGKLTLTLPGTFTVKSVFVKDFGDSNPNPKGSISVGGSSKSFVAGADGNEQVVTVNLVGDTIVIESNDSYAIDNIELEWTTPDVPAPGRSGIGRTTRHAWPGGPDHDRWRDLLQVAEAIAVMTDSGSRGQDLRHVQPARRCGPERCEIGTDDVLYREHDHRGTDVDGGPIELGSNVRANSAAWQGSGSSLHGTLDAYNNGLLCAPSRDA
jgi:hypothetical protein